MTQEINQTTVTKNVVVELLKEGEMQYIKDEVTARMWRGPVTVTFTKVDGTTRTIQATLEPSLMISPDIVKEAVDQPTKPTRQPRPHNPEIRTFYDTESNTWKSFRWSSLVSYSYNIAESV